MPDQIDAHLAEAEAQFVAKRPKTAAMHQRAALVMPGGNTRTILFAKPFPIRVDKAEGCRLHDIDGHSYIDLVGEYSAGIYGHSHPRIAAAVADAVASGINMGAQHEREVLFAEAVCKRFQLDRVRFTNSGTEANMFALATARHFTGKQAVMPMVGGYHGGTLYFGTSGNPMNAPFEYVMGRYNDVEGTRQLILQNAARLGVVILEPMQGSGGCIGATPEFLKMLREVTAANNIVLLVDEVMTSRLHPNGLCAKMGITPDLKTFGKYIGGGMSFGAFGGKAEIMDLFNPEKPSPLPHAGTFNNNTLTMTAGRVGITEIFTPEACVALNARGENLKTALNELFMRYQAKMQVTGIGSLLAIHPVGGEIKTADDAAKADLRLKRLLYFHLLDDGIYLAERGYMAMSLVLGEPETEALKQSLERFLVRYRNVLS